MPGSGDVTGDGRVKTKPIKQEQTSGVHKLSPGRPKALAPELVFDKEARPSVSAGHPCKLGRTYIWTSKLRRSPGDRASGWAPSGTQAIATEHLPDNLPAMA